LSAVYYRRAEYAKALEYARRALDFVMYDPDANYFYALISRRLGDFVDAKETLGWAARSMTVSYTHLDVYKRQPMYDGVPFNQQTNQLEMADVGLNALYVADCRALAEIAGVLGKDADQRELLARGDKYAAALGTLWDETAGIYPVSYTHLHDRHGDSLGGAGVREDRQDDSTAVGLAVWSSDRYRRGLLRAMNKPFISFLAAAALCAGAALPCLLYTSSIATNATCGSGYFFRRFDSCASTSFIPMRTASTASRCSFMSSVV